MSDVVVRLDERIRVAAAVLAVSQWPVMEQEIQPHAVHTQSKLTRQFMGERTGDEAVISVNQMLTDEGLLSDLFTAAVRSKWPTFKAKEELPTRFRDGTFNQQLADCNAVANLAEEHWPVHEAVWNEAVTELTDIFADSPLPSFLGKLCGKTVSKTITIVPTLTFPMLNSVICETADELFVVLPPPKAWGESPPWPFRDGVEWSLGESCRELLHHILAEPLNRASSEQVELLKHAAATLFIEESLTEIESMSYLVRAKRQYNLPQLPIFVEQLRDCLNDEGPTLFELLGT